MIEPASSTFEGPHIDGLYDRILGPASRSVNGTGHALSSRHYQLARALDGRPLDATALKHLRNLEDACQTQKDIQRGNVTSDVAASAGDSYRRTQLNGLIANELIDGRNALGARIPDLLARAVATDTTKAGNCGELTAYFTHLLMCKNTGLTITTKNLGVRQAWAEAEVPSAREGETNAFVISPHSRDPIMDKADTVFNSPELKDPARVTSRQTPDAHPSICKVFRAIDPARVLPQLPQLEKTAARIALPDKSKLESDYSVINPAFRERVQSRLADKNAAKSNLDMAINVEKMNGCKVGCDVKGSQLLSELKSAMQTALAKDAVSAG